MVEKYANFFFSFTGVQCPQERQSGVNVILDLPQLNLNPLAPVREQSKEFNLEAVRQAVARLQEDLRMTPEQT